MIMEYITIIAVCVCLFAAFMFKGFMDEKRYYKRISLNLLNEYGNGEKVFEIPYSREEMAKFLCVDRCALSRELSKMKDDGILLYKKNRFELL